MAGTESRLPKVQKSRWRFFQRILTYPNGIKSDFNYDILNRITEYTASNGGSKYIDESFKFDNNSNITEKITDGKKESYGYDSFGRLISILDSVSGQNVAMEYNIRSNITKETALNPMESSYNVGTYTWNSLGFATSYEDEKGEKYNYNYNSKGLRTQKITDNSYVNYFYTKGGILNAQDVDGMKMSYINGHQTLAKVQDGKIYYYIYNSHGDVIKLVDKNGNVVNEYSYDVWGITKTIKSETYNDIRYTGQIYDEESGNYYLRARYYNPQIKRFISRDGYEGTLDNPISQNRYIYCLNSPLIYFDPTGNKAEKYVDEWGIVSWSFSNLNIKVYQAGDTQYDSEVNRESTPFHQDMREALKGEQSLVIDDKGTKYYTIEDLIVLDKKFKYSDTKTLGRTIVSCAADVAAIIYGAKEVQAGIKCAKPIAKSLSNGLIAVLKPGKDITGINYIISTVENFASEDDLVTKGYNQVLNVVPFVGTIKGIKELICNEAKVEIINYGERD